MLHGKRLHRHDLLQHDVETEDGTRSTEQKTVTFNIPENAERSLSVDRSYLDTAEAKHTTKIVGVDVNQISCDAASKTGLASR